MRDYEIVYIFRSNFTPEEIEARIERYHALLTGDGKGEITAVEQWGKRQLAYPIQKQPNGYYVVAQFTADPAALHEFERVLKLEEDLLRYLIVLSEGELPIPGSMQSAMDDRVTPTPAPRSDDASEQDEEGDGDDEAEAEEETADDAGSEEDSAEVDAGSDDSGDDAGEAVDGAGDDDADAAGEGDEDEDAAHEAAEDDDAADDAAEKEE